MNENNTTLDRREFVKVAAAATVLAASGLGAPGLASAADAFALPPLPYAENALEPVISAKTISFHYGKHTAAYYANVPALAKEKGLEGKKLEEIIVAAHGKDELSGLYNNAAQSWNHTFYWNCLKPGGGGAPAGKLGDAIKAGFGSWDACKELLVNAGMGQFGSGWAWLVEQGGKLAVVKTANAVCPLATGAKPILTLDVWEHAYYLDYQNKRKDYLAAVLDKLINWDFAAKNLA